MILSNDGDDRSYKNGFVPYGNGEYWALAPGGVTAVTQPITAIAAQPIDWSVSGVFRLTLPAAGIVLSPVFSNAVLGQTIRIVTTQGAVVSTNNWTNVGGTSLKFTGGTSTLTATVGAIDVFEITCIAPGVYIGNTLNALA